MSERTPWSARFFTIWTGQQLSIIGSRAARFALVWWLTATTGSGLVLAMASFYAYLPQILLGPFVGTLVDRWNRRVVMIVADSFIALVSLWLAYMFYVGAMEPWHLYVVMLATSFGDAFHWPAMAASTTLMVPEKHLTRVSGLNQTINGALAIVSPMLGAALMAILPIHGIMLIDVATAAFAVLPLLFLAIPQPSTEAMCKIKSSSYLSNVVSGLRYVLHWRGMVILLVAASIVKIVLQPAFSLVSLLVLKHFGGDVGRLRFPLGDRRGWHAARGPADEYLGRVQTKDPHLASRDGGHRRRHAPARIRAEHGVLDGPCRRLRHWDDGGATT